MSFKEGNLFYIEDEVFDKIACNYIKDLSTDKLSEEQYIIIDNSLGLEYNELDGDYYTFIIKDVNKLLLAILRYGL